MTNQKIASNKSVSKLRKLKVFEIFPDIISKLTKDGKLDLQDFEQLESIFGARVKKALELVGEGKVRKFIFKPSGVNRWVVTGGKEKNYLVLEHNFCSCKDFLFNALYRREIPSCYHLLAREIAEKTERYDEVIIEDEKYSEYMNKWLS